LGNSAIGERDLQIILRDNISTILKDLGFTSVATRSQLRKESQERAEERANREVAQPTVPESGTVPREEVEVRPSVQIIRSKKDLESLFGWGRNIFSISGFDIKSSETVIAINLGFFNNKTQMDLARLVIVGKEKDFDRVRIGSLSFGGLDLERRDPQQGQEARALAACLQNLEKILSEKLEAQERKAGQIGEIIGVKGNLVSIDLGKENNVEVGMRFTVDGTLKAEKGEDFPVPDLATLVVISVSETENQATCRVVGPLNEHGNPIFSMVPGYTVRPETPTAEEPAEEAPSPASSPESGGAQEV